MTLQNLLRTILNLFLLIILMSIIIPFSPKMPASGLDASWALALNQAVFQGLSFGKDIIFTLGPYSSIYTKAYHPATDLMMVGGSLYLALTYWICCLFLMRSQSWYWIFALGIGLLSLMYARDSLFFSYPLVLGLLCHNFLKDTSGMAHSERLTLVLLFTPLGLLALVKGSLLILSLAVLFLCLVFLMSQKQIVLATTCLFSFVFSTMLFWICAGQSLSGLPDYIITTLYLVSHFTQAMSYLGNTHEILMYLIASSFIILIIFKQKLPLHSRYFLSCLFFLFLFISFKTGFTRHYGHAFIASTSLPLAGLLLPYASKSKMLLPLFGFILYTSCYISMHYTPMSPFYNIKSTYFSTRHGLVNRINNPQWLKDNFDLSINFIKQYAPFPKLSGKTDIYSYNQAYLFAGDLSWSPRPIFQSYSVFTPWLAQKNKDHLLGDQRPDNVIFSVEPIDNRLPSLEEGLSWPVLLRRYQPASLVQHFLFLTAKNTSSTLSRLDTNIKPRNIKQTHVLDEVVHLPRNQSKIWMKIHLKPSFYGRLVSFFFQSSPLCISLELKNGIKKEFQLIPTMADSQFLISPLIENTEEFLLLYDKTSLLKPKQVLSFSIYSPVSNSAYWKNEYTLHLTLS